MEQMLPWVESVRQQGLKRWSELGFPSKKDENWRYTNLKALEAIPFVRAQSAQVSVDELPADFLSYRGERGLEVVFVNGHFAPSLSNLSKLPRGVRVGSVAQLLESKDAQQTQDALLLKQMIDDVPSDKEEAFAALNLSHLQDGCFIAVEPGVEFSEPLHLVHLSDPEMSGVEAVACDPRTVISLGPRSALNVIESYVGFAAQSYFMNAVTDIQLAQSAQMKHLKLEREGVAGFHMGHTRVRQAQQSQYRSYVVAVGAQLSRHNLQVSVQGSQCETELFGLYLAQGRQHVDMATRISHLEPGSRSRQHYKGILDDHARAVFRGFIHIVPEAQQTDSSQLNNNMLLTSTAEVDSIPQLEIYADDVKATHGATVGQLSEEEIFYIRSRAISETVAKQMVMYGFAESIVEEMGQDVFAEKAKQLIESALVTMATKVR